MFDGIGNFLFKKTCIIEQNNRENKYGQAPLTFEISQKMNYFKISLKI